MTDPVTLIILTLAAARLTRLVTSDSFPPIEHVRRLVAARWPADFWVFPDDGSIIAEEGATGGVTQKGVRVEWSEDDDGWVPVKGHWFGELISCPWCSGVWVSAGVVGLWWLWPPIIWLWLILAVSGVAAWLVGKSE